MAHDELRVNRRTVLQATGVTVLAAATAGCGGGGQNDDGGGEGNPDGGSGGGSGAENFDGWMDDVDNFEGVEDATGRGEVTVQVGAEGNGGNFAFEPPAIRISTGTTVVWEWTGEGASHNVVDNDGNFASEMTDEAGFTFEHSFDSSGTYKYVCEPHEAMGMKGVMVVE